MGIKTWQQECDDFNHRLTKLGVTPSLSLSEPTGILQLAHADFDAFEGVYGSGESPRLMLTLCTAGGGKMGRFSDQAKLEGIIRPGSLSVALPHSKAEGYCASTSMLGMAINLPRLESTIEQKISVDELFPASSNFHQDPILTTVMTQIWRDAETNGLSSAFFEHGLLIILQQLSNYRKKESPIRSVKPLSGNNLKRSLDMINSQLGSNIRVTTVAKEANLDVRTFTRAFRAATGYAPFEYLTMRRIQTAKELLLKGHTVTDVSILVGYANPSKFAAAFRRVNGSAPRKWLASNK